MLKRLQIGSSYVLPGFIMHGTRPNIVRNLGRVLTASNAMSVVDNLNGANKRGDLKDALKITRDELFKEQNGARLGVPRSVLLFVDNNLKPDADLNKVVKQLRDDGVRLIVVTQGKDIDENKIKKATPGTNKWFFPDDLDEMEEETTSIIAALFSGIEIYFDVRETYQMSFKRSRSFKKL